MTKLSDYEAALRVRGIMDTLVQKNMERQRPAYRLATVTRIDWRSRRAMVNYSGENNEVPVNIGSFAPTAVGQVVRVDGLPGDRYITEVFGGNVSLQGRFSSGFPGAAGSPIVRHAELDEFHRFLMYSQLGDAWGPAKLLASEGSGLNATTDVSPVVLTAPWNEALDGLNPATGLWLQNRNAANTERSYALLQAKDVILGCDWGRPNGWTGKHSMMMMKAVGTNGAFYGSMANDASATSNFTLTQFFIIAGTEVETTDGGGLATVSWPYTLPNGCASIVCIPGDGGTGGWYPAIRSNGLTPNTSDFSFQAWAPTGPFGVHPNASVRLNYLAVCW